MFKKTRIKILATIASVLVLLLSVTLCVIYIASYKSTYYKDFTLLRRYVESVNTEDNNDKSDLHKSEKQHFTGEDRDYIMSTFYSVTFSEKGEVIAIDNDTKTAYSDDELKNLAVFLREKEESSGIKEQLLYYIKRDEIYTTVAFMDNTIVNRSFSLLFRYTLIFGSIAILLLFLFSVFLARRIVKPLEESYKKQKQFISNAGHELKTPVSVISANAEMLSREIGDNDWLSNIQYENQRMSSLIRQLMVFARVESITPNMEQVDLSRVVMGEILLFESVVYERGLNISYNNVCDNVFVLGNREQLGQLLSILLDNAVEYCTESGTIILSLTAAHGKANLTVSNDGTAIPKEYEIHIFERFYQVDSAQGRDDNHYGLGLSIAKVIVSSHHGEITVSCIDGLVTFCVSLPVT